MKSFNSYKVEDTIELGKKIGSILKPGDVVLLAPACASMDMFKNFEERGDVFVSLVRELESKEC